MQFERARRLSSERSIPGCMLAVGRQGIVDPRQKSPRALPRVVCTKAQFAPIYVHLGARAVVDERGSKSRRMREIQDHAHRPTLAEFKAMVRDQTMLLLLEPKAAVAALRS